MFYNLTFAEYFTTLATVLSVLNFHSSPSGVMQGLSLRPATLYKRRSITPSTRLYLSIAVPYVAASVLVQEIATEEVSPIFIAAVALITVRFNKSRHTFVEWVFKSLRTFTCVGVLFAFMLLHGLSGEVLPNDSKLKFIYSLQLFPQHALFAWITSFRWFVLLLFGFDTVPEKHKKSAVLLAALEIGVVWVLINGTRDWRTNDAWVAFDAVIVTRTPLRDNVFVLYSVLIALDTAESVTGAIVAEKRAKAAQDEAPSLQDSVSDEIEIEFGPVLEILTWDEFFNEFSDCSKHFLLAPFALWHKAPSDVETPPDQRVGKHVARAGGGEEADLDVEGVPIASSVHATGGEDNPVA